MPNKYENFHIFLIFER